MQRKYLITITAISLLVILVGAFLYSSSVQKFGLISISQLYVDPQGSVDSSGALTGSYWNLLFSVNEQNVVQGVKLPNGTTSQTTINGVLTAVKTGASVEVHITPLQPYLIRDLQAQQVTVAPAAKNVADSGTQSALTMTYYDWFEPSFRIYTPYKVDVFKNGVLIGSATLNSQGGSSQQGSSSQQSISTTDGTIIIQNIGQLLGTYLTPDTPSQITILNTNYIYDWAQIQSKVDGSSAGTTAGTAATKYSDYWYGVDRSSSNQAINPVITFGYSTTTKYAGFPGWEGSASGTNVQAVKPVIYSSDKSTLPSDKRSFLSLTEWLQNKGISNLISSGSAVFGKYTSCQLVTDTNGKAALEIGIPWNAYATPLVTMRIPTEMADTWVDRPQVSDVTVNAYWQANGQTSIDISAQAILAVGLTQKSTVTSSARITATSSDPRVNVYPVTDTETLASGGTKTIYFAVGQTGGTTADNNVLITINSYETYAGTLKESDTVTCNLLATLNVNTTSLSIYVKDDSTQHLPIVGLQMQIQYPPSTGTTVNAFTDSNGAVQISNLVTPAGGGYVGQVYILTEDTLTYTGGYTTTTVHSGQNDVSISVHIKGTPYPSTNPILQYIWYIVAAIAIVSVIAVAYYIKKKKERSA